MKNVMYRAWDKANKVMVPWDVMKFKTWNDDYNINNYEYMDCITLPDKNGKEIYEGDIIEIRHPHKGRYYIGPVVYDKYAFTAKDFYFPHYDNPCDPFEDMKYVEVVGNIFENPELLEKKDIGTTE